MSEPLATLPVSDPTEMVILVLTEKLKTELKMTVTTLQKLMSNWALLQYAIDHLFPTWLKSDIWLWGIYSTMQKL